MPKIPPNLYLRPKLPGFFVTNTSTNTNTNTNQTVLRILIWKSSLPVLGWNLRSAGLSSSVCKWLKVFSLWRSGWKYFVLWISGWKYFTISPVFMRYKLITVGAYQWRQSYWRVEQKLVGHKLATFLSGPHTTAMMMMMLVMMVMVTMMMMTTMTMTMMITFSTSTFLSGSGMATMPALPSVPGISTFFFKTWFNSKTQIKQDHHLYTYHIPKNWNPQV